MNQIIEKLGLLGVIPVVTIDDPENAVPLATALVEGGLPCTEITFRTDVAADSIKRMAQAFPSILIGAGTVLHVDQVKLAVDSGAKFIVSPGVDRGVVEYCLRGNIPVIPGVITPTEIQTAIGLGLDVVKFFPAAASGGVEYLTAVSAPFKQMKFIPTGGIDVSSVTGYLKLPCVLACGGSWMVKPDILSNKRFTEIGALVKQAAEIVRTLR